MLRRNALVFAAAAAASMMIVGGHADVDPPPPPMPADCFTVEGKDYKYAPGNLFPSTSTYPHGMRPVDTAAQCCDLCKSFKNCSFWTYENGGTAAKPQCYQYKQACCILKTEAASGKSNDAPGAISGSMKPVVTTSEIARTMSTNITLDPSHITDGSTILLSASSEIKVSAVTTVNQSDSAGAIVGIVAGAVTVLFLVTFCLIQQNKRHERGVLSLKVTPSTMQITPPRVTFPGTQVTTV